MTDVVVRFKDFSTTEEPVRFQIGDDIFTCVPEVPVDVLIELAEIASESGDRSTQFGRMRTFFESLMDEESFEIFSARMKKGAKKPIGFRHIRDIMMWLMEVYGLRPTQQSDESADGSDSESISSTEGASAAA